MKFYTMLSLTAFVMLNTNITLASNFSFTGNFMQDDAVQFFRFILNEPSNINLQTYSVTGGINASGMTIAAGGFQSILNLWTADGIDLGGVQTVSGDSVFNIYLNNVGSYILALTEYNNRAFGDLPGGITDPTLFDHSGDGNFTAPVFSYTPDELGSFFAPDGSQRSNKWALDISNVSSAQVVSSVPLSDTYLLMVTGLLLIYTIGGVPRPSKTMA